MTSLRARLGFGLVTSLALMIGLLWLTVGISVRHLMEQQLVSRLAHDAESLLGGLDLDAAGHASIDSRRIQGIFQQPFSGHYYQVDVGGEVLRSRSLWDRQLPTPRVAVGETRLDFITGPQQQSLLLWTRGYRKQGRDLQISVAEELDAMLAGMRRFRLQLAAWSLALLLLLLLIQRYIVARSLHSVSAAADDVVRLERGEITTLDERVPDEVRPLVSAINTLLQRQRQRLLRSREALGNLAHGIKTPLTVLQQLVSEKIPADDAQTHAQLQRYGRQINEQVDKSLRRARLAGDSLGTSHFDLQTDLPLLVDTLNRLHRDKTIVFRQQTGGAATLPMEQQDGMELLGNLLDNAWKWARSTVLLTLEQGAQWRVLVEDDGPGIDAAGLQVLAQRGLRQDENIPGHGIGLSIVKSLVAELGGTLQFRISPSLGGLQVGITFGTRA
ncbi:MAG TPA: sensor histidine kinase [Gammaproteobacteria bacterium]|nr:sensor histidine kinase [Gammaproteobacteria bacterium]